MEKSVIITNLDKEGLIALFEERVETIFDKKLAFLIEKLKSNEVEELLSRKDVASIYNISLVSLRDWEQKGIIPKPFRKGSRVYFRKAEILEDIKKKGGGDAV